MAKGSVEVLRDGTKYSASWEVEKDMIVVTSTIGSKRARLGTTPPDGLALAILSELVTAERARSGGAA